MIKAKLNIQVNTPTPNGRIYPRNVLKKAFKERLDRKNPLYVCNRRGFDATKADVDSIIGKVIDYEIEENDISIDIHLFESYKDILEKKEIELCMNGLASIEEDHITIKDDLMISHLYVTPKKEEL